MNLYRIVFVGPIDMFHHMIELDAPRWELRLQSREQVVRLEHKKEIA